MDVQTLVKAYRTALLEATPFAPHNEQSLYALHQKQLECLISLLQSNASQSEIALLLKQERRAYGWSFLSGSHGARVESAFHALSSHLEAGFS